MIVAILILVFILVIIINIIRKPCDQVPAEGAVVAQEGSDAAAVAELHQHAQPPLPPLRLPVPEERKICLYIYSTW